MSITTDDLLVQMKLADPAALCRKSTQQKSDAEIHAHWLRKEVAKLLPMAEIPELFNPALPFAHAIAEFIASDLIVKSEFSSKQVAAVITKNDCDTSKTCEIASKEISYVYNSASKTNLAVSSDQHIRLHRDDPVKEGIKSLVKDGKIDSPDPKYKLALFKNDPVVDGEKKKSKDAEKPEKILDQGTIVNIGCSDVLFKSDSGKYTLLKLGDIITDNGPSIFNGNIKPTKLVISSHVKIHSQEQYTTKQQVDKLYELQFGLGQIKFNKIPQTMDTCDSGGVNGCFMNPAIGQKFAMLTNGKYVQLTPSGDETYPYLINVYDKNGTSIANKGNFAIENMNSEYLMLKPNGSTTHILIGLQKMLDQASVSFTGVSQQNLNAQYIDQNSANGSKKPLLNDYVANKKFSPMNAGDSSSVASTCTSSPIASGCTFNVTVGKLNSINTTSDSIFGALSGSEYLKFDKNADGSVKLNLYDAKNTLARSIMDVKKFYVNLPKVLLENSDASKNVILDVKNELGTTVGASVPVTLTVPTQKILTDFIPFSDELVIDELAIA